MKTHYNVTIEVGEKSVLGVTGPAGVVTIQTDNEKLLEALVSAVELVAVGRAVKSGMPGGCCSVDPAEALKLYKWLENGNGDGRF